MQRYILSAALFCLAVQARRERDSVGGDEEDDDNIVWRNDRPSGYEACDDPVDEDKKFMAWINGYGRNYSTMRELKSRFESWRATNKDIRENNEASHHSGNPNAPFMDHNEFSDMYQSERELMLGYIPPENVERAEAPSDDDKRRLATLKDKKINYSQKIMGPVQNQGRCGSCWSFATATPFEGTLTKRRIRAAKKAGLNHKPIKWRGMSKQQTVDCTYRNATNLQDRGIDPSVAVNWGCDGGWMEPTMEFYKRYGAMWEEDYPYFSGNTATEGACMHDQDKVDVYASSYIKSPQNGYSIRQDLQKAPISIAIGVGNKLMNYSSGVIPKNDNSWCSANLNHAVTLVGYTPGDVKYDDKVMDVTQCRPKWPKDYELGCERNGHYSWKGKYCCKEVEKTVQSSNGVWRIQNSWDTWWGEDGYYFAEFDGEGTGVCGQNLEAIRVEPNMKRFTEWENLEPL